MPNHMHSNANMVEKGTAPDECSPQTRQFRRNPILNTTLGNKTAVYREKETVCSCYHQELTKNKAHFAIMQRLCESKYNYVLYSVRVAAYNSSSFLPVVSLECSKQPCSMVATSHSAHIQCTCTKQLKSM